MKAQHCFTTFVYKSVHLFLRYQSYFPGLLFQYSIVEHSKIPANHHLEIDGVKKKTKQSVLIFLLFFFGTTQGHFYLNDEYDPKAPGRIVDPSGRPQPPALALPVAAAAAVKYGPARPATKN